MENKIKLTWRVAPEPTGRYRSFERRAWPSAEYKNGACAAYMSHEESYEPSVHKNATDLVIKLHIAKWDQKEDGRWGFKWRVLNKRASSIAEAKQIVEEFLNGQAKNSAVHPDYREEEVK